MEVKEQIKVAAAKYGADVLMMTKVGDDIFADNTIKNFDKLGIDTKYVEKVKGLSSGVAPIFVDESGQNRIIIVKGQISIYYHLILIEQVKN